MRQHGRLCSRRSSCGMPSRLRRTSRCPGVLVASYLKPQTCCGALNMQPRGFSTPSNVLYRYFPIPQHIPYWLKTGQDQARLSATETSQTKILPLFLCLKTDHYRCSKRHKPEPGVSVSVLASCRTWDRVVLICTGARLSHLENEREKQDEVLGP